MKLKTTLRNNGLIWAIIFVGTNVLGGNAVGQQAGNTNDPNNIRRLNNQLIDANADNGDPNVVVAAQNPFAGIPLNNLRLRRQFDANNDPAATRRAGGDNNDADNFANNNNNNNGVNRNRADEIGDVPVPQQNPDDITAEQADQIALRDNRRAAQRSNVRSPVVEPGTATVPQDDPYAPIGIRIGSMRLTSIVEQSAGFSSNRQGAALGDGGGYSVTNGQFRLQSEWERHQLNFNAVGEYETFFDDAIEANPQVNLDASMRIDLRDGYDFIVGGDYSFTKEAATSINLNDVTVNEPAIHGIGGFAQLQRSGHKLSFQLRGSLARSLYEDAKLAGGGTQSQADRDATNYSALARVGYEISPAISPFIQAQYTRAQYDLTLDRNGNRRDSDSYDLRGGIAFDFGEKFNGEIAIGYLALDYVDPGLANLAGLVTNANINWSPQRDTNVNIVVGSTPTASTIANDSGSITYNGQIDISRRVRDNLDLNAGVTGSFVDYSGLGRTDITYGASVGFDYWINRNLAVIGAAQYTRQDSTSAADSFDVGTFTLGLRLQK